MKNLFFAILAMAVIFTGTAQTKRNTERARQELAVGMASFVNATKPAYKAGQTYADFQKALCGTNKPAPSGAALLKKAFEYHQKRTSESQILSSYDGKEMAVAVLTLNEIQSKSGSKVTGAELFGSTTGNLNPFERLNAKCKWYDLPCHLANLILWISNNQEAIGDVIEIAGSIVAFFNIGFLLTP